MESYAFLCRSIRETIRDVDYRTWEEAGAEIKARREDLHLTQTALAEKAGLSLAIVQVIEGGRKESYRRSTLVALARALDWPKDAVDRLLTGEDPETFEETDSGLPLPDEQDDYNAKIAQLSPEAQAVIDTIINAEIRKQQQ